MFTVHSAEASTLHPLVPARNSMTCTLQDKAVLPGYEASWQREAPIQ